jgi:hypothetical protein
MRRYSGDLNYITGAVNAHQLSRDALIALSKVKAITQKAIYWEENRRQMSSIIN